MIERRRRRGWQRMRWLDGITNLMDIIWASSGSWWWTGKPDVLQSMGPLRVRNNWATELTEPLDYVNFTITQWSRHYFNFHFIDKVKWSEVSQSCPTLCDPMDYSPPGSSIHGILQARILEWVAISFSRGSSWPRDWTQVSCIVGRRFNLWATREALFYR